jgi:16S rRNA processing protein RimM
MSGDKKQPAGSPTAGGPAFLIAGKVRRPHGVRGEMVVEVYTDFPERLRPKKAIYLGEKHTRMVITSQRMHNEGLLLGFEGITTPEQAGLYRNYTLYVTASDAEELPEGEYYFHELFDLNVVDEAGKPLGILTEIVETGANDVYVVTDADGKEILLPAIPEVVLDVDLDAKTMIVHLLPGLIGNETDEA